MQSQHETNPVQIQLITMKKIIQLPYMTKKLQKQPLDDLKSRYKNLNSVILPKAKEQIITFFLCCTYIRALAGLYVHVCSLVGFPSIAACSSILGNASCLSSNCAEQYLKLRFYSLFGKKTGKLDPCYLFPHQLFLKP